MTLDFSSFTSVFGIMPLSTGILIGILIHLGYTWVRERTMLQSSKEEALRVVDLAHIEAKAIERNVEVKMEAENARHKSNLDKELKSRKRDIKKLETKVDRKESQLTKKLAEVERSSAELSGKAQELEQAQTEVEAIRQDCLSQLERVSEVSREEAKDALYQRVENEFKQELGQKVSSIVEACRSEIQEKSIDLIAQAVQKSSRKFRVEGVVSVVRLSSQEQKGKIIGKDGRNIRAFKDITGLDVLLDDAPDMVALSGFDAVQRVIGARTLKILLEKGRVNPERIKEVFTEVKSEVEKECLAEGKRAATAAGVTKLRQGFLKELGKLKFRNIKGQNLLEHSVECAQIAGTFAAEIGLDPSLARRAGILHDIGRVLDGNDANHTQLGAEFAKKNGEKPEVVNAILSHNDEKLMETPLAFLVAAANAISTGRRGARAGQDPIPLERLAEIEEIAKGYPGVENAFAVRTGTDVRILVEPIEGVREFAPTLPFDMAQKLEQELKNPGHIMVALVEEGQSISCSL
jgi:ribonucrease Y